MKLATLKDGSRDGQLAVVSRDLASAHFAAASASRLQQVLDDWNFISPQLEDLYAALNAGKARHAFAFDPRQCMAPLPRAYQWVSAAVEARGREGPALIQRAGDDFIGACDDARFADPAHGIDFEAALAVVTSDVTLGTAPDAALESIRLVMLANSWSLRQQADGDRGDTFHGPAAAAFGPVALTPDELGPAWRRGRVHRAVTVHRNGELAGSIDAGPGMAWHFGQLVASAAATRNLRAGAIVGSGPLGGATVAGGAGCIAATRAFEAAAGAATTPFMQFGETIRIEMHGGDGHSLFGAIEQKVAPVAPP